MLTSFTTSTIKSSGLVYLQTQRWNQMWETPETPFPLKSIE
ncbi:uncharacterized protein METZ01_LOCUS119250, partial [marine metagenome]